MVQRGYCFSEKHKLAKSLISSYAEAAGDLNPLHHDEEFAKNSRFGSIVASGTHLGGLLMGATATEFYKEKEMLGLEYNLRFQRPVLADELIEIRWAAKAIEFYHRFDGELVRLDGQLIGEDGETSVKATGLVLIVEKL